MESKKGIYTLDNAPLNKVHARIISYTVGGSLVDGYILGIIEFAIMSVAAYMGMSASWQGLIASSPLIGVFIGSLVFGDLSDKIGRQKIYTLNFFVILVASVLQFFVDVPVTLFALRLLLGICIGAEYAIGPTIVSEFVPSKYRGRILSLLSVAWAVGYVAAAYAGAWMQGIGEESWRWMLASSAVIAVIVLVIRVGMPETPRWLILNGREDEARAIIKKHFGDEVTLEPTIEEVHRQKNAVQEKQLGFIHLFSKKQYKRTIFAAICWGANTLPLYAILTFVPIILKALGITDANTFYTLILNGMMVLASIIVIFIVDIISRRKMVIWGTTIAAVPLAILGLWAGAPPMAIVALFTIHLFGNSAFGTVAAYVYPVECFPTELRTTGVGFCSAVSRLFGVFGTFAMPIIIEGLGISAALIGIAVILFIALVLTIMWAPETKGESVDNL